MVVYLLPFSPLACSTSPGWANCISCQSRSLSLRSACLTRAAESIMSFFKRNDPGAPAARRSGAAGGQASYDRHPADTGSYTSLPGAAQQPLLPQRRAPPPQEYSNSSQGSPQRVPPPQQYPDYNSRSTGEDGNPREKAEYRPSQSQAPLPSRGHTAQGGSSYPGQAVMQGGYNPQGGGMHGVSTGSGRGVFVFSSRDGRSS